MMVRFFVAMLIISCCMLPSATNGQVSDTHINQFRYNDDFSYLAAKDSLPRKALDKIRWIPLSAKNPSATISFGANNREIVHYYRHESFHTLPADMEDSNGFSWYRFQAHADIRFSNRVRIFTQLNSAMVSGRAGGPRPGTDKNIIGLHQFFADIGISRQPGKLTLRIGRQELGLVNSFLLTPRDAPNQRLAFNAARLLFKAGHNWQGDIIIGQAINYKTGSFDDGRINGRRFMVVNARHGKEKKLLTDLVFIASRSNGVTIAGIDGNDKRITLGITLIREKNNFGFEYGSYYQAGRFSGNTISAYAIYSLVRYSVSGIPLKPFLSMSASAISGDRNRADGKMNTFNVLYSRPYYGLSNPLGRTNNNTLDVSAGVQLPGHILFKSSVKLIWLNSLQDGLYNPGGLPILPKENPTDVPDSDRRAATSLESELSRPFGKNVMLVLSGEYVIAGPYIRKFVYGRDISYFSATLHIAI